MPMVGKKKFGYDKKGMKAAKSYAEKEGKEMEILSMATDKYKKELYGYHNYADSKVDRPFLNNESILLDE